ncbi:MAG: hypothetical protein NTW21_06305 [Verrucomicrobia bacterium]|nr:hypothetical protein [Verrucomicrobiota bacterium]
MPQLMLPGFPVGTVRLAAGTPPGTGTPATDRTMVRPQQLIL